MGRIWFLGTNLLGLLLSDILFAAPCQVTLNASVTPSNTELGRKILYEVQALYPPGTELTWPNLAEGLGEFQIQDFRYLEEAQAGQGRVRSGVQYELNTFVSGDYVLPGISVHYVLPSGEKGEVFSSRLFVTVRSPEVSPEDQLRGIEEPISLESAFPWPYAMGALFVLAVIAFLVYLWRKRAGIGPLEKGPPPWEQALSRLSDLDPSDSIRKGEWKSLYVALSWLFRAYLEGRYTIPALEETTSEIEKSLLCVTLQEVLLQKAVQILNACDRVKYAKFTPSCEEGLELKGHLEEWIKETIPAATEDDESQEKR